MNDERFDDLVPMRNPASREKHRRDVGLQIITPLILVAAVVLLAGGYLAATGWTGSSTGFWRDLAMIWLVILGMILGLVPLALLAGLVVGITRLIRVLPVWTFKLQRFFERAADVTATASRAITGPLIRLGAVTAGLRQLARRGRPRRKTDRPRHLP
ncbi:MAG TPA: hypothetical protein VMN57_02410 [Anaerolineales bacterium]|nr:hypothetical protein [Anaerolineales bacterium]